MNVLFLMISYPNVSKNKNMYTDLVNEFYANNDNIYVVAPSLGSEEGIKNEGKIKVLRVKTGKLFNVNIITKGFSNIKLPYQFNYAIDKYLRDIKFDLVITPTPPITFCSTINKIKKRDGALSYLILRDIFPQNAKDLGLINNSILFRYFRRKEKKLYNISDKIGCMSQGNINYLINNNNIDINKLHVLSNWTKVEGINNSNIDYRFQFDIKNKFVGIYGGNIGKPQNAEFIIELANSVRDIDNILFLIIGQGTEKTKVIKLANNYKLNNVIFHEKLPRDEYMALVKQCDFGLVNLSPKFTIPNIPSRALSYWEAGIPILASIDENTDFGNILEESNSGLYSITGNLKSYKENLLKLYKSRKLRECMGKSGYNYLLEELSVSRACNIIKSNIN